MDTGDAMLEFGMSTIQECTSNNVKGAMHLLFMIGRNSCYSIIGWNLGFYPYPDWSSSHPKFLTNHKMSTIWFRTVLKLPLSRGFSVPVHVVSPAPWDCEIKQYSHHLFHDFGRRARVQAGLYAFLPPFSSFRCTFPSEDIQHPPVRWTTSQ